MERGTVLAIGVAIAVLYPFGLAERWLGQGWSDWALAAWAALGGIIGV